MEEQALRSLLQIECVEVTFTKKDGTKRVMFCTTNPNIIPATSGSGRPAKEGIVTVYDLEVEDWRCFYFDSILEIKVIDD